MSCTSRILEHTCTRTIVENDLEGGGCYPRNPPLDLPMTYMYTAMKVLGMSILVHKCVGRVSYGKGGLEFPPKASFPHNSQRLIQNISYYDSSNNKQTCAWYMPQKQPHRTFINFKKNSKESILPDPLGTMCFTHCVAYDQLFPPPSKKLSMISW